MDAIAAIAPKMSILQHILDVAKGPKPRSDTKMEAIFGHSQITSRYALGSGETLGVNQANSVATKVEGSDEKSPTRLCEGSRAIEILP